MKFLPNPAFYNPEDAIVNLDTEDAGIFHLRFNVASASAALGNTHSTAMAVLLPLQPLKPFAMHTTSVAGSSINSDVERQQVSLCHVETTTPNDTTGSGVRYADHNPINYTMYDAQFSQGIVLKQHYSFKISNYEDHPIMVGLTVLPAEVQTTPDTNDEVTASEFGQDLYESFAGTHAVDSGVRLQQLKKKQNTIMGIIPAGQFSGGITRTSGVGADQVATQLHMTPGVGVISQVVDCDKIMTALAKKGGMSGYDVKAYSFPTTDWIVPAASNTQGPITVILWACPVNAFQEFQGAVAADSDDHFDGLTYMNVNTTNFNDFTAKIYVEPKCRTTVRLFDPVIPTGLATADPDYTQN